jgi:hypothetical protein
MLSVAEAQAAIVMPWRPPPVQSCLQSPMVRYQSFYELEWSRQIVTIGASEILCVETRMVRKVDLHESAMLLYPHPGDRDNGFWIRRESSTHSGSC